MSQDRRDATGLTEDTQIVVDLTELESESAAWLPPADHPARGAYARVAKRELDIGLGFVLLILSLPIQLGVFLLSTVLVRRWPILRLPRVTKNGETFTMFRFATSRSDGRDGRWSGLSRQIRRWGLDELPQLWNVLMGQMGLVGPRPLSPENVRARSSWGRQCQLVRPGIIGLAQVERRSRGSDIPGTRHFDIQYIDQLSLRSDIRILLRTLPTLIRGDAYLNQRRRAGARPTVHTKLMLGDIAMWLIAVGLAMWAHLEFDWSRVDVLAWVLSGLVAAAVHLMWAGRHGVYRMRWRLTSMGGLTSVISGAILVAGLTSLVGILTDLLLTPGVLLPGSAIYVVGAITTRLAATSLHERRQRSQDNKTRRLLVFGAGEAGTNAAKAIYADPDSTFVPVAFLDDNRGLRRSTVLGLPVIGGREDIATAARRYDADTILIAMPSAHPRETNDVASTAEASGLEVQVLPPLAQWLSALLVERTDHLVPELSSSRRDALLPGQHVDRDRRLQIFDLAVVGLGYVGLPLALEAASVGLRVCGLDTNRSRIDDLNRGSSYIDDIAPEEVQQAIESGFMATTDPAILALADAITISVPTPLRDGLPDLGAVVSASETAGDHLLPGQLVVLESTTYPGTTEEVVLPILESRSGLRAGVDFHLAYSPERIDPGNTEFGIHNTPKLIAGIDQASTERAAALYGKFCPVVDMTGTREAEMAKLLENTYRHVNIALINELAVFSNELGVDIWETIRGASSKPFGFQAFYPGPGVGGHCIPIDPSYLSYRVRQLGKQFRFIELAQEINEFMPSYVTERSLRIFEANGVSPADAHVLLLGVAYKPDVSDVRETTATAIVRNLRASGATVEYVDPHVESFVVDDVPVPRRLDPSSAVAEADLTLVHTPHRALRIPELVDVAKKVFDLRGAVPGTAHERI